MSMLIQSLLSAILIAGAVSCRTDSGGKEAQVESVAVGDIGMVSEAQWVEACQKELADPKKAAQAKADLVQLAGSDTCEGAYTTVRQVLEQFQLKR